MSFDIAKFDSLVDVGVSGTQYWVVLCFNSQTVNTVC